METEAPSFVSRSQSRANRETLERCVLLIDSGQEQQALAAIESLLETESDHPVALYTLALLALRHGSPEVALESLLRAHQRDMFEPLYPEALSVLYLQAGNFSEGVYLGKLSLSLGFSEELVPFLPRQLPTFSQALERIEEVPFFRKANLSQKNRSWSDAILLFRRHLAFFPGDYGAKRELGRVLLSAGLPSQALVCLEELREIGAAQAEDLSLMGQACLALGEVEAAESYHRQACTAAPDLENGEIIWSHLASLLFYPDASGSQLALSTRGWGDSLPVPPPLAASAVEGRRIRVGYLVSSLTHRRDMDVIAATIAASDPQQFEVYFYGWLSADDRANAPLRGCYDEWRDISDLDYATVVMTIRGDEIDLLVDAGGLAAPLHAMVLTQRAAPRQISWLGNTAGTLGISQVDAELVDEADEQDVADPAGAEGPRRLPLPYGLYCYDRPLPPERQPGLVSDHVLFGADVGLAQLHPDLLALWAAVLAAVPGAKLVLRDRKFSEDNQIDRLVGKFQAVGIADRIEINNCSEKEFFRQVDVALMPLVSNHPHDAIAALCEGTPVVTLAGNGRHRRVVAGVLRQAELGQLVAETAEDYVNLARRLATEPTARAGAISAIVQALKTAPPFDPDAFAVAFDEMLLGLASQPVGP